MRWKLCRISGIKKKIWYIINIFKTKESGGNKWDPSGTLEVSKNTYGERII